MGVNIENVQARRLEYASLVLCPLVEAESSKVGDKGKSGPALALNDMSHGTATDGERFLETTILQMQPNQMKR